MGADLGALKNKTRDLKTSLCDYSSIKHTTRTGNLRCQKLGGSYPWGSRCLEGAQGGLLGDWSRLHLVRGAGYVSALSL